MPSQVFPVDFYTSASARVHPVTGSAGPTLFLAPRGTGSSLHIDTLQTHFWMMLCHGKKRWRLVSRDDVPFLHPLYLTDLNPVFPTDLNALEATASGNALGSSGEALAQVNAEMSVHEVLLEPGDLIFVPAGWPHQVDNLETSVAVSANFVDSSNLARSLEEAEALGLVEETPQLMAEAMRSAASAMPSESEPLPEAPETLRAFKARHGERRAPWEVQQLLTRALLAVGALACAAVWAACSWYAGGSGKPLASAEVPNEEKRNEQREGKSREEPGRHARRQRGPCEDVPCQAT